MTMMQIKTPKSRLGLRILAGYIAVNLLLFFLNPYASPWHYDSQDPAPIEVTKSTDADLALDEITRVLDSIDLAYGAREATNIEELWRNGIKVIAIVCLPSTFALVMKDFIGYMGPANAKQRAFTLSVKQRYNHLARLAISKGTNREGFLFQEEPSLTKKNGEPFASLR